MHSHSQTNSKITPPCTFISINVWNTHKSTRIHMFSMKQTGRNIMVSGRNGVRFPIGPASSWWAMGLEMGPGVCMCVFACGYARLRVCLRLGCFHSNVGGRTGTHPDSRTEEWLWSRQSGLEGLKWLRGEAWIECFLKAAPWQVAERLLSHYSPRCVWKLKPQDEIIKK